MPRVKTYDREEVLAKAMWVFWENGFLGSSIQDLVEAMGINRFSIYDSFESKEELFTLCLKKYRSQILNSQLAILSDSNEGLESVSVYLRTFVNLTTSGKVPNGCLMVNTLAEFGNKEPVIAEVTLEYLTDLKSGFDLALTRARELKEISPLADKNGLAELMVGIVHGLGVLVRIQPRMELEPLVDQALMALKE